MRTANHLAIESQCRQAIQPLMKKHALGQAVDIVMDLEGWVNPCFFVNSNLVFRFNARDPGLPKYQREKIVFDFLKKSIIPVPQKVTLDESKSLIPFDVLICEMIPGKNLASAWPALLREQRQRLAESAGRIFKQLSAIEWKHFGELASTGPLSQTKTWIAYLDAKLSFHLQEALELNIFDQKAIKTFRGIFSKNQAALQEVSTPYLVHGDFHFGNLLFVDETITGVVDFEWAFAGDPLYDLFQWRRDEEEWPNSRDAFLKACHRESLSEAEITRTKIYQMLNSIELCVVAKRHFSRDEAESYKCMTLAQAKDLSL